MHWIKHHPAQFAAALAAVGLLASTALLYTQYASFADTAWQSRISTETPLAAELDLSTSARIAAADAPPGAWNPKDESLLFAAESWGNKGGRLERARYGTYHPPVPNTWLLKHGLDPFEANVLANDPDRDGFSTYLEWLGPDTLSHAPGKPGEAVPADDSTSPVDAASHPPYHTRLEVAEVRYTPFVLQFMMHEAGPKAGQMTVQVNVRGARSFYGLVGDLVPNSPYRIEKLEQKVVSDGDIIKDVSELTLVHQQTGRQVVLPFRQVVNSPESHVILRYRWTKPGGQPTVDDRPGDLMAKRRDDEFTLPTAPGEKYRVMEIRAAEVDVQLPSGEKYVVGKAAPVTPTAK
jgi:hypothetical protein